MDNTENALLCEKMAEVIEKRGHAVGSLMDQDGSVCLLGAGRLAQVFSKTKQRPRRLAPDQDAVTASTLGFLRSSDVWAKNDGRYQYSDEGPLDKETAIEFVMERAKYWRNK